MGVYKGVWEKERETDKGRREKALFLAGRGSLCGEKVLLASRELSAAPLETHSTHTFTHTHTQSSSHLYARLDTNSTVFLPPCFLFQVVLNTHSTELQLTRDMESQKRNVP